MLYSHPTLEPPECSPWTASVTVWDRFFSSISGVSQLLLNSLFLTISLPAQPSKKWLDSFISFGVFEFVCVCRNYQGKTNLNKWHPIALFIGLARCVCPRYPGWFPSQHFWVPEVILQLQLNMRYFSTSSRNLLQGGAMHYFYLSALRWLCFNDGWNYSKTDH